jgi:hypothetical protein
VLPALGFFLFPIWFQSKVHGHFIRNLLDLETISVDLSLSRHASGQLPTPQAQTPSSHDTAGATQQRHHKSKQGPAIQTGTPSACYRLHISTKFAFYLLKYVHPKQLISSGKINGLMHQLRVFSKFVTGLIKHLFCLKLACLFIA